MGRKRAFAPTATMALVLAVAGCASGPGEADVVAAMTDDAIVPHFEQAAESAGVLSDAVDAFCESPAVAKQTAAQEAWHTAKRSWEMAELGALHGPGRMLRTVAKVDYEPVGTEGIDDLLASDTEIDFEYVDSHAASTHRGLGTVEYLLFRDLDDASNARTCELTTASAEVIEAETAAIASAWTDSYEGGAGYRETFTTAMGDAMGNIVSAIVETLETQAESELGRAIGTTVAEADPTAIPEGAAGAGAERYVAQLEGIRAQLDAGGDDSLMALLETRSEDVAAQIDRLLDQAITQFAEIDRPLVELAREDPGRLADVQREIDELETLFEADVVSALDITLGFSDTDSDSG